MRRSYLFATPLVALLGFAAAGAAAQADWTQFSSFDGEFTALFPQSPEDNADSGVTGGVTATTHILAASNVDVFCSVSYTDYSPRLTADPLDEMESSRENFLSQFHAVLIESHSSILEHARGNALPALAFSAANDDDMFKLFVAVDGSRSYMVLAASEKIHPDAVDMDRCIDGFHLTR